MKHIKSLYSPFLITFTLGITMFPFFGFGKLTRFNLGEFLPYCLSNHISVYKNISSVIGVPFTKLQETNILSLRLPSKQTIIDTEDTIEKIIKWWFIIGGIIAGVLLLSFPFIYLFGLIGKIINDPYDFALVRYIIDARYKKTNLIVVTIVTLLVIGLVWKFSQTIKNPLLFSLLFILGISFGIGAYSDLKAHEGEVNDRPTNISFGGGGSGIPAYIIWGFISIVLIMASFSLGF